MKKLIFLFVAILAVSCNKSFEELNNDGKDVFNATIETTDSKVVLVSDGKTLNWENGDQIKVNGNYVLTATVGEDKTKATFTGTVPTASKYEAFYPSDCYFTLPSSQTYKSGKFSNIPMYASSTTKELTFKNVFAVLKISVSKSVTVNSIKVSSDLQINGSFDISSNIAVMKNGKDENKTTVLNCGNVAGTDFFIAVPAGNYTGKKLKVTLIKSDNSEETMTTNQSISINLTRNTIYSFNFRKDGSFKLSEETINNKEEIL